MTIQGYCDSRFAAVREAFAQNFDDSTLGGPEVGASVCVMLQGEPVVDLWGGLADRATAKPWQDNTLALVWSCTKGIVALAAHLLVARRLLDLDSPVARYWPEFAQTGKDTIPVRWLLTHQAALPAIEEPMAVGEFYQWNRVVEILAAAKPMWMPGTRQGYHALTFGHLIGEVIQRVTKMDLASFLREELVGPLDADFHLGLAQEHESRVSPMIRPTMSLAQQGAVWRFLKVVNTEPQSVQSLIVRNTGRRIGDHDTREAHAAILPSQGGIGNARSLATLYRPFAMGGSWDGVQYVDRGTLSLMQEVASASPVDAVLLTGMRFSCGFMKSTDNRKAAEDVRDSVVLSPSAFGHAGMGGSLGFADPGHRLSFGYVMNKQGQGVLLNSRGQSLVDAVYRSLGCRPQDREEAGMWV
jgi:CubicO group peptidase (beta-lactamase class C family)